MATNRVWFSINEIEALFEISQTTIRKRSKNGTVRTKFKKVKIGDGNIGVLRNVTLYSYVDMTELFGEPKQPRGYIKKLLKKGVLVIKTDEDNKKIIARELEKYYSSPEHLTAKQKRAEKAERVPVSELEEHLKRGDLTIEEAERILKIGKAKAQHLKNQTTQKELISREDVEQNIRDIYSVAWSSIEEMLEKWGIKYHFKATIVKEMTKNFRETLLLAGKRVEERF